jgi:large subunit ribosomal protein L25
MKQVALSAQKRENVGKEISKKLRKQWKIPAIIYGPGIDPLPIAVNFNEFEKAHNRYKGETVLYLLEVANGETQKYQCILKEFQRDPVTDRFIHLDFYAISSENVLEIEVPIEFVGRPVGLTKGGILEVFLHELTVECLPNAIPDKVVIDISHLDLGDSLHVRDIKVSEGVKIKDRPEETVCTVVAEEEEKVEGAEETTTT